MIEIYLQGVILGFSLIMAIGAQNAIVLKHGVKGIYPLWTATICSFGDVLLIAVGIGGLGAIISQDTLLMNLAKWGGFSYLLWMAVGSFRACLNANSLIVDDKEQSLSFKQVTSIVFLVTFLNPHVYLDTVVLLGSIGSQFPEHLRVCFAAGTMSAGIVWFFSLSIAGKMLSPILSKPQPWRIFNGLIGIVLIYVAFTILRL